MHPAAGILLARLRSVHEPLVAQYHGIDAVGSADRRYWTSADGGKTWQESPTPREIGPPGSYAVFGPGDSPTFLQKSPAASPSVVAGLAAASDGTFWGIVRKEENRDLLTVSADHGESWLSLLLLDRETGWVGTADGRTVFVAPIAIRTPISCVRCVTRKDMTP